VQGYLGLMGAEPLSLGAWGLARTHVMPQLLADSSLSYLWQMHSVRALALTIVSLVGLGTPVYKRAQVARLFQAT
jgi:hypothetical protein